MISKSTPKNGSFLRHLFLNEIPFENIFPLHNDCKDELLLFIDPLQKFLEAHKEDFIQFDRKGEQSEVYLNKLRELGLFGLIIPESYGGFGFNSYEYAKVLETIGTYDASTALTVGAHSSIGMKGLLLYGTDNQKEKYLPKLATGEIIAAFCLTEAGSGSDAASIKTVAKKNSDGSWVVNGEKIWISNGIYAGFFTVFARTGDKLSAFIVDRTAKGVSVGPKEDKMGIRASATNTVTFTDVELSPDALLGEENNGFKIAMSILNSGRTGLGGGSIGAMKRCIGLASNQAMNRKQFGKPIADYDLIKGKIAEMTLLCYASEAVVNTVAGLIDRQCEDYSLEAAACKIFTTESLWYCSYEALQIAGGNGFMREYPYEMIVRDSRINMIFEGTNEILRLFLGLTGLKETGEYLKKIGKDIGSILSEPVKGIGSIYTYASKKFNIGETVSFDAGAAFSDVLLEEYKILDGYTAYLFNASEELIKKYRNDIVKEQLKLKRIAEAAIELFVSFCFLSRVATECEKAPDKKEFLTNLLKLHIRKSRRAMNQSLRRITIHEDDITKQVAFKILEAGKYNL
jgi:acyl-CoA dehydrogenase family member 9